MHAKLVGIFLSKKDLEETLVHKSVIETKQYLSNILLKEDKSKKKTNRHFMNRPYIYILHLFNMISHHDNSEQKIIYVPQLINIRSS